MSGHSHWATHKHQKGINDAKRGIIFTKYGRLITIAAREGGSGNPTMNFKLRLAIDQAKSVNMPKENIDRAVKVGTGEAKDGVQIDEILYEGYGPGQVALIIETATDNRNRTVSEIKSLLTKGGGKFVASGAVSFMFRHTGLISFSREKYTSLEALEAETLESGADDFFTTDEVFVVVTAVEMLQSVEEYFRNKGFLCESAELGYVPTQTVSPSRDELASLEKLLETLEDHQDVQKIWNNLD